MSNEGRCTCHEREFCPEEKGELLDEVDRLRAELERVKASYERGDLWNEMQRLKAELSEQARLHGMGSEREAKLMAEVDSWRKSYGELARKLEEAESREAALREALEEIIPVSAHCNANGKTACRCAKCTALNALSSTPALAQEEKK